MNFIQGQSDGGGGALFINNAGAPGRCFLQNGHVKIHNEKPDKRETKDLILMYMVRRPRN